MLLMGGVGWPVDGDMADVFVFVVVFVLVVPVLALVLVEVVVVVGESTVLPSFDHERF